jgi:hypothetical protein
MMCGFDPQTDPAVVDKACVRIGNALVDAGAIVDKVDKLGWNALHMSALRGLPRYTKFLIQQTSKATDGGAENPDKRKSFINHKDEDGQTAIMKAISHGHSSIISIFRLFGLDYEVRDNYNATILHHAVQAAINNYGHTPVLVEVLKGLSAVPRGEIIDSVDVDGRTALMYAVLGYPRAIVGETEMANYFSVVRLLLDAGADPRKQDMFEVSVMSMCPLNSPVREMLAVATVDIQLQEHKLQKQQQEMVLELEEL